MLRDADTRPDADTRAAWHRDRSARMRGCQELIARASDVSDQMRVEAGAQRDRLHEQRRRWDELCTGDARIERLWPHLTPPAELPVRVRLPAGRAASVLLCGICDEVLATGTYAADLTVTLRCVTCLGYNTGAPLH